MSAEAIAIAATTKPRKSASAAWDYALYLAIVAIYTLPYLWSRDLLYRDETRYGAVVREMIRNDAWLTLTLNDRPYLEKPPLFFALIRAVAEIAGSTEPWVFLAVVAASAFFFVTASHLFLRSIGADRSTVRLANLLLLAMAWLPAFMNYLRMDLLFAGFVLLSLAAYARGIERAEANLWPLAGGLMAAIAILVKGPFGGLMPLLTVIAYAVASGKGRRLFRIDLLASLAVAVLPVAAWFGLLYARFGREAIARIFGEQLIDRAVVGHDVRRGWWLYLVWAPLSFMPWLLLLPALRLPRMRAALFGPRPIDWRRLPRTVLFTLSFLVPSFLLLNLVAQKNIQYLVPLLPGFAVLIALAYRRLEPEAPRLFDRLYLLLAAGAVAMPVFILAAPALMPTAAWTTLTHFVGPEALNRLALFLFAAAVPLFAATRLRGDARLYGNIAALAITVTAFKAAALPDFTRAYSPRALAAAVDAAVPDALPLFIYRVYEGSLSYHYRKPNIYVYDPAVLQAATLASDGDDWVLAPIGLWRGQPALFPGFASVSEHQIESTRLVLLHRVQPR